MKHFYLTTAIALTCAFGAWSQAPLRTQSWEGDAVPAPARVDDSSENLDFGWCNDWMGGFSCFSGNNMGRHSGAIELPPEVTTQFDGKKITSIKINRGMYDNINEYTLFATNDLDGERIISQDVTVQGPVERMAWMIFPLDTPLEIEGGKSLFLGFDMNVTDFSQNPYWVDDVPKDQGYGCWVNYAYDGKQSGWVDFNYHYGSLLLRVEIEGVSLPDYDAAVSGLDMMSYVQQNTSFDIGVRVINKGKKPIKEVTVEYTIGDLPTESTTVGLKNPLDLSDVELAYNQVGIANIADLIYEKAASEVPVYIRLLKLNGEDDANPADNTYTSAFLSMDDTGYKRAMLMEEVTGTWCGNCPRGIVAIQQMLEKYGEESFIPIAVHCGGADPMCADDYDPFIARYTGVAAPTAMYNRNTNYEVALAGYGQVERIYKQITAQAALAKVELSGEWADEEHTAVRVKTATEFSSGSDKQFRLAFALTENGVGPYTQTNYYAGGQEMGGWESLPSKVPTIYSEVARALDSFEGIPGSLPAEGIEKGTVYNFERIMPLDKLDKTDDFAITAMVIDTTTGEIVNARRIKNTDITVATAPTIEAAGPIHIVAVKGGVCTSNAGVEAMAYNTQGALVAKSRNGYMSLTPGIYLVKAGQTVAKVRVW